MNARTLPEPRLDWALFLDFDGCIVDIAPTPDAARVPDCLPSLLVALREALGGAVAIVSGRPIEQIDGFLGTAVPAVAGLHGLERRTADGGIARSPSPQNDLHVVRTLLQAFAAERAGVLLEDKTHTLALHYRASPSLRDDCRAVVDAALERAPHRLAGHRRQVRVRDQTAWAHQGHGHRSVHGRSAVPRADAGVLRRRYL